MDYLKTTVQKAKNLLFSEKVTGSGKFSARISNEMAEATPPSALDLWVQGCQKSIGKLSATLNKSVKPLLRQTLLNVSTLDNHL